MTELRIEQHMGLMKKFSFQVMRRLQAAGSKTTVMDDIMQECAEAWCKARDKWDPEAGVPFVAYFKKGMVDHVNRFVGKEIFHYNGSHFELDAELSEDGDTAGHELVADHAAGTPEDAIVESDRRAKALARLSPRARQFIELCESPPKCLVDTVNALRERREYALARKLPAIPVPKRVLPSLIFRFMGATRTEQTGITRELEQKFNIKANLAEMDRV
jgi:DNA-directed RNA polymerase specialized sigma24 family protein